MEIYSVVITLDTTLDASVLDDSALEDLAEAFASAANLPREAVSVIIRAAGSVILEVSIDTASESVEVIIRPSNAGSSALRSGRTES